MKIEIKCYSYSDSFVCREYKEFIYVRFFSNFKRMKKWNAV